MTPQEFVTMKATERYNKMEVMTDEELEQLRLECRAEAKATENATKEINNKMRNASSWIAQIQTNRKYA